MSVGFNLSLSDLLLCEGFAEAFGNSDEKEIYKHLKNNGMDVDQEIAEVVCRHRNLRGQVVDCLLYQGHELNTEKWLKSGYSSWSNIVESCDLDLRIQLKTLGQNYNNTNHVLTELKKNSN